MEQATVDDVRHRWWFGRLIANTDMHFGNLCFFLDDALPLTLAPSYDMLPMLYRPAGNGAVVPREFQPPAPIPGDTDSWRRAARWAEEYWVRVAACDDISAGFRDIATSNAQAVATSRHRFGM